MKHLKKHSLKIELKTVKRTGTSVKEVYIVHFNILRSEMKHDQKVCPYGIIDFHNAMHTCEMFIFLKINNSQTQRAVEMKSLS